MSLRDYQHKAVESIYKYYSAGNVGNPLVVVPTGGGKSHILAEFIRSAMQYPDQAVMLLSHRKEILEQNAQKLLQVWPQAPLGIYSAGLGSRKMRRITIAGIQSIYNKASDLLYTPTLLIIDEAHLVPRSGDGMYQQFISDLRDKNPYLKIIGFTATPFRLDSGYLHRGDNALFDSICYEVTITELINSGYLVPLISKNSVTQADLSSVRTRGGEYVPGDVEKVFDDYTLTQAIIDECEKYAGNRQSWLFFTSGVSHAEHLAQDLNARGHKADYITGNTSKGEREYKLGAFKARRLKALVNCDVLTTGFDAPNVDMICLARATKSVGLYIQMVGRGTRLSPGTGKANCLVLDFGGNIDRHGPVDKIVVREGKNGDGKIECDAPTKTCPECRSAVLIAMRNCPDCGYAWPEPASTESVERTASRRAILSEYETPEQFEVAHVDYHFHTKRGDSFAKPTLRVTYFSEYENVSEWICFEHDGFARKKAEKWWKERKGKEPIPTTIEEALDRCADELTNPTLLWTKQDGKFTKIISAVFNTV